MLTRTATIRVPTLWGWLLIAAFLLSPPMFWVWRGEQFLSVSEPVEADVLVVEGWIGGDGVDFAADIAKRGEYRYVLSVGVGGEGWRPGNYPDFAKAGGSILRARGISASKVVEVPIQRLAKNRTASTAEGVRQVLHELGFTPKGVNVVTRGTHARRSRMEFRRALDPIPVGTLTFRREYPGETRWWHSTDRAMDFLDESVKYGVAQLGFF